MTPLAPRLTDTMPSRPWLADGMITPLVPYAMRGAIWYQGEANVKPRPQLYHKQLTTLVGDWRARWGQGDFSFLWVQLPNYQTPQKAPVESTGRVWVREGDEDRSVAAALV